VLKRFGIREVLIFPGQVTQGSMVALHLGLISRAVISARDMHPLQADDPQGKDRREIDAGGPV
jgi:hypothetical protein